MKCHHLVSWAYGSSRWVACFFNFSSSLFHLCHFNSLLVLLFFIFLICSWCALWKIQPKHSCSFDLEQVLVQFVIGFHTPLSCYFLLGFWVFIAFIIWFILCFESLIFWIYTCFVKSCSSILSTIHSSPFIWLYCFLILGLFNCLNLLFFALLVPF